MSVNISSKSAATPRGSLGTWLDANPHVSSTGMGGGQLDVDLLESISAQWLVTGEAWASTDEHSGLIARRREASDSNTIAVRTPRLLDVATWIDRCAVVQAAAISWFASASLAHDRSRREAASDHLAEAMTAAEWGIWIEEGLSQQTTGALEEPALPDTVRLDSPVTLADLELSGSTMRRRARTWSD